MWMQTTSGPSPLGAVWAEVNPKPIQDVYLDHACMYKEISIMIRLRNIRKQAQGIWQTIRSR